MAFLEGRNFLPIHITNPSPSVWPKSRTFGQVGSNDISEFTTDIRHIRGKYNHVADALSRATIMQCYNSRGCGLCSHGHQTQIYKFIAHDQPRLIVPVSWRRTTFDLVHGLSVQASRQLIARKFVWHRLRKQVGLWAKACIACQTSKIQLYIKAPHLCFDHIHVNLVHMGPLPSPHWIVLLAGQR
jgi:hypothetical protein